MIEFLQKGLSAIQSVYVALGVGGILALIVNILVIVKNMKDKNSGAEEIKNAVYDKLKEHDIDVAKMIENANKDNKLLADMLAIIASKMNIKAEDLKALLDNYKKLTTSDGASGALADNIVETVEAEEEEKELKKITVEEEINQAKNYLL